MYNVARAEVWSISVGEGHHTLSLNRVYLNWIESNWGEIQGVQNV